jgi:hypothetical protein
MVGMVDDQKVLESIVEDQLEKLIRERHPDDYKEFVEKHASELDGIKRTLSARYTAELRKSVNALRPQAD